MTYSTTGGAISVKEATTHYAAICKQIDLLDTTILDAHNRLSRRDKNTTFEALQSLEIAWRLRRQLCEDRESAKHTFTTVVGSDREAQLALAECESCYR